MHFILLRIFFPTVLFICFITTFSKSQDKNALEIYGFIMLDAGYNFMTINPDYYDELRVSNLPSYENEFAPDGKVFYSVRQTRFGVKSSVSTSLGELKTLFEFDMFGSGQSAGQTAFRLRHAYGQIGHFGAGKTWSTFMDPDIYPNSLEHWGPPGILWFRNIQIHYMPLMSTQNELAFALENPGGTGDEGKYSERIDLDSINSLFNIPDFTGHYRYSGVWGYAQLRGIVGSIKWRDNSVTAQNKFDGSAVKWGGALSVSLNMGKSAELKMQGVYGEGIGNYMNDSPVDVAKEKDPGDTSQLFKGVALPVWGISAFIDFTWSKLFASSFGYSVETIKNSDAQRPISYKQGQYGLINLLYYPVNNVMAGVEYNFGRRDNFSDGFHSTDSRIQFTFKYTFSKIFTL